MWCPEGYLRWDEFRDVCRAASRRFLVRRYGALEIHTWGAPVWSQPLYLFIDDETGAILSPSEVALQKFADKFADQYCYECHGKLDTPSTRDNLKGWLHFELSDARALASQFEGQVLCVRADVADQFTASAFDGWQPNDSTAVGAGLRDAYRCFIDAYPRGKETATWPEVERVTGYSRRQIGRAMKKYSG